MGNQKQEKFNTMNDFEIDVQQAKETNYGNGQPTGVNEESQSQQKTMDVILEQLKMCEKGITMIKALREKGTVKVMPILTPDLNSFEIDLIVGFKIVVEEIIFVSKWVKIIECPDLDCEWSYGKTHLAKLTDKFKEHLGVEFNYDEMRQLKERINAVTDFLWNQKQ